MCIALIGGMDRLGKHYRNEAKRCGVELKIFNKHKTGILSRIKNVDAVVIFTNKVSHNAKKEVVNAARTMNIPVLMYHSCGVCTLRNCLNCLKNTEGGEST